MGRGIFTGLIWGGVVGFGILTVANEIVAPVTLDVTPVASTPMASPPAAPASAETQVIPEGTTEATPALTTAPEGEEAPEIAADMAAADPNRSGTQPDVRTPEGQETPPETETAAAAAPEISAPTGPHSAPDETMERTAKAPVIEPVLTPPQGLAPEAETPDALPFAVENAPLPTPEGSDVAPERTEMPDSTSVDTALMEAAPEAPVLSGPAPKAMPGTSETGMPQATDPLSEPQATIRPGEKVGSFTEREDARKSLRLPSIAAEPNADGAAPMVLADDLPALVAYSADYAGTPAGPMMSIVLVDIAELGPNDPILSKLPFPVTFAVDAVAARAGDRAKTYRDKGLEVMAMVSLPEGGTPQDASVTLQQAAELVPVSIGFLDVPSGTFQSSRTIAAQVVATAQDSGRGILTFPRGLNALEQEAQRADAPAALVFRDFDGRGQDIAAIKRFLDQAAFRANIDEKIVLLGRSKPETIQALAEWSLGNRAAAVSIVPLSYLLTH
ncbi:MAG: divergent polysaccharide deacetylase family protein [Alphaproteobacteria bacterium]|nr:divergent polysaccharide deacetylase family protein [Alphaproteobacteria bacterium]MBU1278543.1 divergent polysaccharide deacetylase family protein [Alphaproteobacteria bacterium]MBU1571604.1 divergent polysaccharide deacetylase family protein [Alphaproteobacteria bacterium]MBU1827851.1 divergent polysaccharide deacetylase family protein [Alphaproteobacteria bacterium]MBU2079845.1 divergent polysaccharide deacetylase family protein [Alphaproteobacteria bacterium]